MKENSITPELLKDILSILQTKQATNEVDKDKINLLIKIIRLILENEDYNHKSYPYFLDYYRNPSIETLIKTHIKNIRTCVRNLNSLLLSPLHALTALAFHANMFNIGMKSRLVFARIDNKIKPINLTNTGS